MSRSPRPATACTSSRVNIRVAGTRSRHFVKATAGPRASRSRPWAGPASQILITRTSVGGGEPLAWRGFAWDVCPVAAVGHAVSVHARRPDNLATDKKEGKNLTPKVKYLVRADECGLRLSSHVKFC